MEFTWPCKAFPLLEPPSSPVLFPGACANFRKESREIRCPPPANFSWLCQSSGGKDLRLGRPGGPFLAGNRVRAPPPVTSRPEGWLQTTPHSSACAQPGRVCLQIQLPSRVVREKGSHARPLVSAPGLFCSADGRLVVAALALSPELPERTPGCLFQEKETASILVKSGT